MKKEYNKPTLTIHGNAIEITKSSMWSAGSEHGTGVGVIQDGSGIIPQGSPGHPLGQARRNLVSRP